MTDIPTIEFGGGKSMLQYSPQPFGKRDADMVPIDPDYEPSIIPEHRVDSARMPKDRVKRTMIMSYNGY